MHRKSIIVGVLAGVLAAGGTAAYATGSVPHALGAGGGPVPLNKNCSRKPMYITPAGKVWEAAKGPDGKKFVFEMQNIDQAQIKCLIRRVEVQPQPAADTCFTKVGAPPTVTVYNKDDWKANDLAAATKGIDKPGADGVDALQAWTVALYTCETGGA